MNCTSTMRSFSSRLRSASFQVKQGQALKPDAVFHTDVPSYLGLLTGQIEPEKALSSGLIRIEGDPGGARPVPGFVPGAPKSLRRLTEGAGILLRQVLGCSRYYPLLPPWHREFSKFFVGAPLVGALVI